MSKWPEYRGISDTTFDKFDETNYNEAQMPGENLWYEHYNLTVKGFEEFDSDLRNTEFNPIWNINIPHRFIELRINVDQVLECSIRKDIRELPYDVYVIPIPDKTPRKFLNWARETFHPILEGDIQKNYNTHYTLRLDVMLPILGAIYIPGEYCNGMEYGAAIFRHDMSKQQLRKEISKTDYNSIPWLLYWAEDGKKLSPYRDCRLGCSAEESVAFWTNMYDILQEPYTIPKSRTIQSKPYKYYYDGFKTLINA